LEDQRWGSTSDIDHTESKVNWSELVRYSPFRPWKQNCADQDTEGKQKDRSGERKEIRKWKTGT